MFGCFSGGTPQASYADIARMASSGVTPPTPAPPAHKWPSVGQPASAPAKVPLWTANVTLHPASSVAAAPAPLAPAEPPPPPPPAPAPTGAPASAPSQDAAESAEAPKSVSTKRDAMTSTVSPEASPAATATAPEATSVGNLLSDNAYPPLKEHGKSPVNQTVKSFIYQASRSAASAGSESSSTSRMANCVDVEHCAKRPASPLSARKPVIILDELETDAGVVGDPELTFGFEVNEQLLAGVCESSGEEEACPSPDAKLPAVPGPGPGTAPSHSPSSLLSLSPAPSSALTSPTACTPSSTASSSGVESAASAASVKPVKEIKTTSATPQSTTPQPAAVTSVELQQIVAFVGQGKFLSRYLYMWC